MGAIVANLPFIDIDGRRYAAFYNNNLKNRDGSNKSVLQRLAEYTKTSEGSFRSLQLLSRITQLVIEAFKEFGNGISHHAKNLVGQFTWVPFVFPYLPSVTQNAIESINGSNNQLREGPLSITRDAVQVIHDVSEAAATWCYAGMLLTMGNTLLKNFGDGFNLLSDVTDLQMASQDWEMARSAYQHIKAQPGDNREVADRFVDTMRYALIRIAKAAASAASGVIGISILAMGGPVLPAMTMIGVSLFSTIMGMSTYFYKGSRPYEIVDFFKIRSPEVLVSGVVAI